MPSLVVAFGSLFAAFAALVGGVVLYRQHRRLWRAERTTGRVVSAGVEPRTTPWSRWWPGRAAEVVRVENGEDDGAADAGGPSDGEGTDGDSTVEYEYRGGGKPTLRPAVEYEYRVGGREYAGDTVWPAGYEPTRRRYLGASGVAFGGRGFAATVVDRFPEGEPVTVYYDPDDPADAFLLRERSLSLPALCLVLGSLLALWAVHCSGLASVFGGFVC